MVSNFCSRVIWPRLMNLRGGHTVEWIVIMAGVGVEIGPELHQKESFRRTLVVQLLQSFTLLRELVLDLPHVHRLQVIDVITSQPFICFISPPARSRCSLCDPRCGRRGVCGSCRGPAVSPRRRSAPAASAWWWQCSCPARARRPAGRPPPGWWSSAWWS